MSRLPDSNHSPFTAGTASAQFPRQIKGLQVHSSTVRVAGPILTTANKPCLQTPVPAWNASFPVAENPNPSSRGIRPHFVIFRSLRNWLSTVNPSPMTAGSPRCRASAWLDCWPLPASGTHHRDHHPSPPIRSLKLPFSQSGPSDAAYFQEPRWQPDVPE